PLPGAWKPAQNAGSHISTATTAGGLLSGKKTNPAKILGSVRFLHRTGKTSLQNGNKAPPGTVRDLRTSQDNIQFSAP
ncbi:MAG TPA: hypothetical protein VMG82_32565, partial [Candidatus Sulfotelmatobacter sp.]|nr:hypothetical protein [Candidatus Sulfotelmatobacter sp.]